MASYRKFFAGVVLSSILTTCNFSYGLAFSFTKGPELLALETSAPALAASVISGFSSAGAFYSSLYGDPFTANVSINFKALGATTLGSASSVSSTVSYDAVNTALGFDATTAADFTAVTHLQPTTTDPLFPNPAGLDFIINDTTTITSSHFRDHDGSINNFFLDVNKANQKALGLAAPDATTDGSITFSSGFSWDFDPSDGITTGKYDFVAVATHEIGHLLGFVSGVDYMDTKSFPTVFSGTAIGTVLDLYRYSTESVGLDEAVGPGVPDVAVLDWTYGGAPYFSLDAGASSLGTFATGKVHGDGDQASHWKDSLGWGLMDPTLGPGTLGVWTGLDATSLDVIGYDLIPEPITLSLLALGGLGLIRRRKT